MKKVFILLILSLSVQFMYGQMDSLFYYPDKNWKELAAEKYTELFLSTDKDTVHAVIIKPTSSPKATIIHFHGQGGNISRWEEYTLPLVRGGFQVIMFDYRGYGRSSGIPTHLNIAKDAQLLVDTLLKRDDIKNTKIIIYGASLGSQVACLIAKNNNNKISGLILDGAMESFTDVALATSPVQFHDQIRENIISPYAAKEDIKEIKNIPLLMIHSEEDPIPIDGAKRMYENANLPKTFWLYEGGHIEAPRMYPDKLMEYIDTVFNTKEWDYEKEFEWIVKIFSENDAGFPQVIEKKGVEDYNSFTDRVREEIKKADCRDDFFACITKWLQYFRKGHFSYVLKEAEWESHFFKSNDSIKNQFQLSQLSRSTLYLKIPSMGLQYKAVMDSLLQTNDKLLRKTPNLIIDIRDCRGGSDLTWSGLEPYLYTSPVRMPAIEFRCTAFTANTMREHLNSNPDLDDNVRNARERIIGLMLQNEGRFSDLAGDKNQTLISTQQKTLPFPKRVGIIACEDNGSADEAFLLYARQSYKVKTFGVNTSGVFDISNLEVAKSPYTGNLLLYSITRIKWLPRFSIDGVGFTPDVYLGDISEKQWIDAVMNHMGND